jgi:SRSO17 transposase
MTQVVCGSESRFGVYVQELAGVIGHADRVDPLRAYCTGLLTACGRKSVEPMAAVTAPERTAAQHQSLLHFVGNGPWLDEAVLGKVRELVLPKIQRHGAIEAWIIDDTGIPKKGRHSVGVAHQYCGQLGKQANCQVAVSLSLANHYASLPVSYRLYLPEDWAADAERRQAARIPDEVKFKTKPQIALELIRKAHKAGLPAGAVLMDAAYGCNTAFRTSLSKLGIRYVASILSNATVWVPGTAPRPPKPWSGRGRPPTRQIIDAAHRPVSVKKLAVGLPKSAWRTIEWREGTNKSLSSRFARLRVRVAHHDEKRSSRRPEEWLLIEWPKDESEPTKYWLSTVPQDISFQRLVDLAKLRWRVERDYQELKQEVGLGHYEGRGWPGFHHHATLCIAAYGFLISERETIPPSAPHSPRWLPIPEIPESYRPRGAASSS